MPNRKRLKGKERKAKQANQQRHSSHAIERTTLSLCRHGAPAGLPKHHPCHKFFPSFQNALERCTVKDGSVAKDVLFAMKSAYSECALVFNNDLHREVLMKVFLSNGIDWLLDNKLDTTDLQIHLTSTFAGALILIESYCKSKGAKGFTFDPTNMKDKDVVEGCPRSLLKFFQSRIPCQCLDEMYAEVRSTKPKTGLCMVCKERKSRTQLFICSACNTLQVCSKECQAAAWVEHKNKCEQLRVED